MKAKRREAASVGGLDGMSDDDLQQVRFFANIVGRDGTPTFTATKDEQARAAAILRERGELP